jgi:hypothetical protein
VAGLSGSCGGKIELELDSQSPGTRFKKPKTSEEFQECRYNTFNQIPILFNQIFTTRPGYQLKQASVYVECEFMGNGKLNNLLCFCEIPEQNLTQTM